MRKNHKVLKLHISHLMEISIDNLSIYHSPALPVLCEVPKSTHCKDQHPNTSFHCHRSQHSPHQHLDRTDLPATLLPFPLQRPVDRTSWLSGCSSSPWPQQPEKTLRTPLRPAAPSCCRAFTTALELRRPDSTLDREHPA